MLALRPRFGDNADSYSGHLQNTATAVAIAIVVAQFCGMGVIHQATMNKAKQQTSGDAPNPLSKPKVFLSYPFDDRNDWIKHCVPALLRWYGCKVLTGDKYKGQEIKTEVAKDISQSNLLVAFVAKQEKVVTGGWTTSPWVLQETGFACGKGVSVVLVVEDGVDVTGGILGNIGIIRLDADAEAFLAFTELRSTIKRLLFEDEPDDGLAVCHLAKRGRRNVRGTQWWDFWLWIDGSDEALGSIKKVTYNFGPEFEHETKEGDPGERTKAFGDVSETDDPVVARVKIEFTSGVKKLIRHEVTLPGVGISEFSEA